MYNFGLKELKKSRLQKNKIKMKFGLSNQKQGIMKRIISAVILMLLISAASFAKGFIAQGKTYTSFGDYTIQVADEPVTLNNETYKAYVISYQNTPMEVKVVIMTDKERKCKKYVVVSDQLSVQYVCNKTYFGVEKIDKNLEKAGLFTSDSALNREAYFHQKLITAGQNPELDNTRLIAAFFPQLLNKTA